MARKEIDIVVEAARLVKEWDERGDPHSSLYYHLLGMSFRRDDCGG